MAGLPTLIEKNIKEKLKTLMSVYREQKKNENKSSEVLIARRTEFLEIFSLTFLYDLMFPCDSLSLLQPLVS